MVKYFAVGQLRCDLKQVDGYLAPYVGRNRSFLVWFVGSTGAIVAAGGIFGSAYLATVKPLWVVASGLLLSGGQLLANVHFLIARRWARLGLLCLYSASLFRSALLLHDFGGALGHFAELVLCAIVISLSRTRLFFGLRLRDEEKVDLFLKLGGGKDGT